MNINKIILLDLEYLSWSFSSAKKISLRKKNQEPEIIQFSAIAINLIKNFKIENKINLYVKIKKKTKIPQRIVKLTGINETFLDKNGVNFDKALKIFLNFYTKNSIVICNGRDDRIIKRNIKLNNISSNRTLFTIPFLDYRLFLKKIFKDKINCDTCNLPLLMKFNSKLKPHNSLNDCMIIYKSIIKAIKSGFKKKFFIFLKEKKYLIQL